jgi:hypothetical protein
MDKWINEFEARRAGVFVENGSEKISKLRQERRNLRFFLKKQARSFTHETLESRRFFPFISGGGGDDCSCLKLSRSG